MLVKNCVTLREIFLQIIQNNQKLLYPVESLNKETGYGFTGWIEHNRVIIGNRAMMQRHDIELPSMDYELSLIHIFRESGRWPASALP